MFRQAGMSKQPMGILASSPELMTTAERALMSGQPVRARNGQVISVSEDRLSEYQNPNTKKRLGQGVLDALSGKSSYKYVNAFPIKDNESPLGVGLKSVGNVLNIAPPYIKDNILAAGKYLGQSRDYELTEEQLAKKAASENAGSPVKITNANGFSKDIPQEYSGSSMDDRYEGLPTDSEMFKSSMERLRAGELAEYKSGFGEDLSKIRSGEVTNNKETVIDKKTKKKSDKIGGDTFKSGPPTSLSLVTKEVMEEHKLLEAKEGMVLPLSLTTLGKGMTKKSLQVLNNKELSEDEKAKTVYEILKGKKANPKDIKKNMMKMLTDMSGNKPGFTSTANYNLMMTGLLIAAGESPNALTNIARGAAQGLQGYGQALEKERAKSAEIDLLAGKLAIGEYLDQEKEARQTSDFVYGSDFTDKDGTVYKAGDAIKATSDQIIALQSAGVEVSDKDTYNNYQKLQTAIAKKANGQSVKLNESLQKDIVFIAETPTALGNINSAVSNLDNQIIQISNPDQKIVGGKALLNDMIVKAKSAMGMEISDDQLQGEKFTTDVDNALIAFAVSLLGEGGKTISNEERKMLYQSLKGFYSPTGAVTKNPESVAYKLQTLRNRIKGMGETRERTLSGIMTKYGPDAVTATGQPISLIFKNSLGIKNNKEGSGVVKKSTTQNIIKIPPIVLNKLGDDE